MFKSLCLFVQLGYDDLRIANRIMRIEDNLMSDHHLVQLLKLDTIGADALSEEKEKQLRYGMYNVLHPSRVPF